MRLDFLRIAAVLVLSVGGFVSGFAEAALGTHAGRAVIVQAAVTAANRALRGTVTVRETDGSLLDGLLADGVELVDEGGRPFVAIGRLQVQYRLRDFLSGRIVLGEVELDSVRVVLEQRRGERFNYQQVLRLGEGSGGGGRPPLVAFRNAEVRDLAVTIRTPDAGDSVAMRERSLTVRRAALPYVRLSSPLPGAEAIRLEYAALEADLSEPALHLLDADGAMEILGDTIRVDFRQVRAAGTTTSMRGRFYSLSRDLKVDLAFGARQFRSDDVTSLFAWLPPGVSGTGEVDVRSEPTEMLVVRARDLDLRTPDGGTIAGDFGMDIGPGEAWAAQGVDVRTRDFDLAYLAGVLDTVPMTGRLTGRTRADGPRDNLRTRLDWRFHDRAADSAETLLRGAGTVRFGVPGDIVFAGFRLDTARLALATVRAISPAVALRGDLEGAGELSGPWRHFTVRGTFAHRRDSLPVTRATGWVRLDLRRDTVGTWAELAFDSLQWDAVRPDYPSVPFLGAMQGTLALAGYADALTLDGRLAGPLGTLEGGGVFVAVGPHLGVGDLDLTYDGLVLAPVERALQGTILSGRVQGTYDADTLRAPVVDLDVRLARSTIGGTRISELVASFGVVDSVLVVDSLRAFLLGARFEGGGRLALAGRRPDSLALDMRAEAIAVLQPLLDRVGGPLLEADDSIGGVASGHVAVRGSIERPTVNWDVAVPELRVNGVIVTAGRSMGRWDRDGPIAAQLEVERVQQGLRWFRDLRAAGRGSLDSLQWLVAGDLGPSASLRAGGSIVSDSARLVRFDSLVARTAADEWRLTPGAALLMDPDAIRFEGMRLATQDGRGRIEADGALPRGSRDSLELRLGGIPLEDVWALLQYDPRSASGELSGTLAVSGTAARPVMTGAFSMRNAMFNEYRTPLLDGTFGYDEQRLQARISTWRAGARIVDLDVSLPLDLAFRPVPRRRLPGPLSVRARADTVDLALLSAVSPLIRQTQGRMNVNVGIEGTWADPELDGFLEIREGAATLPALGVRHRALHAGLSLRGDVITVDTLSVTSGTGTMSVTGRVQLDELTKPELDLRIRARDFRALDIPDFLTLVTTGEVTLRGPVFGAVLTGEGTLPRGTVYFADIVSKNVVELSDTLLAMDSAAAAELRAGQLGPDVQNRFLDSLTIRDLGLTMGNDVHLRSTEADIFLTGRVLVQKAADRYRLDGTLQTPRGSYQLYVGPTIRKQFTVTRGEVRYFGTSDLNAGLDIDARHQLRGQRGENVVVFVHVGGTLLAPELQLTSDVQPALTSEEIIAYLVIGAPNVQSGRDVGRYGVEESVSTLAAQVSGQLSSQLMGDLGVPLDYLEIRPQFGLQGVEATEIAVGRQISDRWFVKLNPRICSKQAFSAQNLGGSLEFRMSREWSFLASADPVEVCSVTAAGVGRLQLGFDLLWEKRF